MMYQDSFNKKCCGTELKFLLIPRQCYLTHRTLWLEKAYKRTAMWTGPSDSAFEYRYYDKEQFLIEKIKGNL